MSGGRRPTRRVWTDRAPWLIALVVLAAGSSAVVEPAAAPAGTPVTASPPAATDAPSSSCADRDHSDAVGPPGSTTRVTAANRPTVDAIGRSWIPSAGLRGGEKVRIDGRIGGTGSPWLYATAREGVERYVASVPATGAYAVDILLADRPDSEPGTRVFDVVANGRTVAAAQDAAHDAGPGQPLHVLFVVPVTDGCLDVTFVPVIGAPLVAAVEVVQLNGELTPSLKWSDEFDGPAGTPVDRRHWQPEIGGGGWGSGELETYTGDAANAHLDGLGHLAIVARSEPPAGGRPGGYTSARLITKDLESFTYGRITVRADMPVGHGLWPGFWMLGTDIDQAGFPGSGEVDIMESDGTPRALLGNVHGPQAGGGTYSLGRGIDRDHTTGFVSYSVLWTPIGLQFLVDDRPYFVATAADLPAGAAWVFDKPFYLLLSLAVGGTLPGPPDGTTPFPAQLLVDDVRVWSW